MDVLFLKQIETLIYQIENLTDCSNKDILTKIVARYFVGSYDLDFSGKVVISRKTHILNSNFRYMVENRIFKSLYHFDRECKICATNAI